MSLVPPKGKSNKKPNRGIHLMMEPRFWTLNKYSLELDGGTNEVTYLEKDSIGGVAYLWISGICYFI